MGETCSVSPTSCQQYLRTTCKNRAIPFGMPQASRGKNRGAVGTILRVSPIWIPNAAPVSVAMVSKASHKTCERSTRTLTGHPAEADPDS